MGIPIFKAIGISDVCCLLVRIKTHSINVTTYPLASHSQIESNRIT